MCLIYFASCVCLSAITEGDFDTLLRTGCSRIAALSRAESLLAAQFFADSNASIKYGFCLTHNTLHSYCLLLFQVVVVNTLLFASSDLHERVCGVLYDVVRPRIIRAGSLQALRAAVDALQDAVAESEAHGNVLMMTCYSFLVSLFLLL